MIKKNMVQACPPALFLVLILAFWPTSSANKNQSTGNPILIAHLSALRTITPDGNVKTEFVYFEDQPFLKSKPTQ